MSKTVIIVGAGQAGAELASQLRRHGYRDRIILIGEEPYPPYRRPPLSKTYLTGEANLESLYLQRLEFYEKQGIECRFGTGVETIDPAARVLRLFDGTRLSYDKLALTTGGRNRRLSVPGADKPNVHHIRTIADVERLKPAFAAARRLVIIGGGYIGLETAAAGIKKGLCVTVLEALPRILARVTAPEISAFYQRVHRARGVDLRTGVGVQALEGKDKAEHVVLTDGTRLSADLVIVGIGLIPNTELAEVAGLDVSNGIVVDRHALTSDPHIVAAGDCANHENVFLGRRVRLESVPNALEQARVAAATLVGKPRVHDAVPWFWSDQYDIKLQMVGLSQGYDTLVIRGDPDTESFLAFYLKDGVVISADAVNRSQEFMVVKSMVAARSAIPAEKLSDEKKPLKDLLPQSS
ncbi:3-phenylpropionate/trans-cinnamate dioxygenase ferredoxin reductase subunit [Fontimonas thermophila]|uniref:3-phenylpropionate/trans-cinnamate dioxygenase ferredoxin reductase subunit n=1 Tax=Fontimonas thermophila TaxID=1076937 RepID=A0A1I2KM67_9GAMM|nr:FAD-dependent oxidoreductase [Fontimonas thermophila]SFF66327.1 3-phenylpropionate/trans-cinnamate dioxygenase ferredoxin reductase subunit [Fontimonas thermophila]